MLFFKCVFGTCKIIDVNKLCYKYVCGCCPKDLRIRPNFNTLDTVVNILKKGTCTVTLFTKIRL